MAGRWFLLKSKSVTEDYAKDLWRSLEKDIFPSIGELPFQTLKARNIVEALEPIKARGAIETVRLLVQRINEIMIYAVNIGLIDANPASRVGMAFEKPKKQNIPTLRPEELPKPCMKTTRQIGCPHAEFDNLNSHIPAYSGFLY